MHCLTLQHGVSGKTRKLLLCLALLYCDSLLLVRTVQYSSPPTQGVCQWVRRYHRAEQASSSFFFSFTIQSQKKEYSSQTQNRAMSNLSLNEAMSLGTNCATPLVWIQGRAAMTLPQANAQGQGPVEPQAMDILCGKSKRCVDHGGSRRFRTVIECYREKYQQALTKVS